jgi:hypothetical protein
VAQAGLERLEEALVGQRVLGVAPFSRRADVGSVRLEHCFDAVGSVRLFLCFDGYLPRRAAPVVGDLVEQNRRKPGADGGPSGEPVDAPDGRYQHLLDEIFRHFFLPDLQHRELDQLRPVLGEVGRKDFLGQSGAARPAIGRKAMTVRSLGILGIRKRRKGAVLKDHAMCGNLTSCLEAAEAPPPASAAGAIMAVLAVSAQQTEEIGSRLLARANPVRVVAATAAAALVFALAGGLVGWRMGQGQLDQARAEWNRQQADPRLAALLVSDGSRAGTDVLRDKGEAPRLMKVGRRTLISAEAAAEWRKEHGAHRHQQAENGLMSPMLA